MAITRKVPVYRLKLVKDRMVQYSESSIADSFAAARFIERHIGKADRENLVAVLLNADLEIVGVHLVALGTLTAAQTTGREVFKAAIVGNAYALVLGHNHPSGCLEPSAADIGMTRKLVALGRMLSIPVLDHVVVSVRGFRSLREMGIVPSSDAENEAA